jgi:hypothetical protein
MLQIFGATPLLAVEVLCSIRIKPVKQEGKNYCGSLAFKSTDVATAITRPSVLASSAVIYF